MLSPETSRTVTESVAAAQATGRLPSVIAAVVRDGLPEHVATAGTLPTTSPDTQYRIGSITKSFTATLILILRDEGKLSLDDPLRRHVPGAPLGQLSLRHLLGHAGGLRREPAGDWWERVPGPDTAAFLAAVGSDAVVSPPYRTYHYSNLGFGLLGVVARRVGGRPWWDQVAERLLTPLGMTRTTYHASEPFARGYVVHPWHHTLREEPRHDAGAMASAGQLWSTAADLATWAGFLAAPPSAVLDPDSMAQMCTPVTITDADAWTSGYGLGLQLWRRGERVYAGHAGSMPGYLAFLGVHRASGIGVVVLANAYTLHGGSVPELGLDLLDTVLDGEPSAVTPWRPGAAPPPGIEPVTGRWWWMGREFQAEWDAGSRQVVVTPAGAPTDVWRFVPEGTDRWRCRSGSNAGEVMLVRRNRAGTVTALDIATAVFTRDPWPPM